MLGGEGLSRSRLARSVVIIFIIGVISRVLGFFREMVLAAVFGASQVTDAYTITFSIPFVVFAAFGSAITTVVLPLLAHYRARGGTKTSSAWPGPSSTPCWCCCSASWPC